MTLTVTTHLNFSGHARAALDFYARVFDGERILMTYEKMGQAQAAAAPDHIMWGQVVSKDGFRIMAFDVRKDQEFDAGKNAFYVALSGSSIDDNKARWSLLAEGGTILQDLAPTQWSPLFGMLIDRFGITWVVDATTDDLQ
ncbi:VOC family protein [Novosphingobium decolorationis]|uniref:VOC family protein n=1 Tax=Novosphingobium decolorationis TaxID=2698673 RepID=A0ABX8EA11_9SPHN|nr:VOC family protein [Novosphingobium decolorationis]QVM85040.1 VOC family protein [Novosphingobium decolorationis]